jgi:hypothetical protein
MKKMGSCSGVLLVFPVTEMMICRADPGSKRKTTLQYALIRNNVPIERR